MKTLFKYLMAVVCLCILLTSCKKDENGSISLAESVSEGRTDYYGVVQCKYDGQIICEGTQKFDFYTLDLSKVSDQEVDLLFRFNHPDTLVEVSIRNIPLLGVPSDVKFDYSTSQGTVSINGVEYSSVILLARGWIRDMKISPYIQRNYVCEISITGKVADKDFALTMSGSTNPE